MYERVLRAMRKCVLAGRYVMTTHADEEMTDDGLTVFDVEHILRSGRIVERQRDREWGGWKYRLRGRTAGGEDVEVVWKIGARKEAVIITVYTV